MAGRPLEVELGVMKRLQECNELEALARELAEALEIAYDAMYLDIVNAHDYPNCERKVKGVLAKAKEVLSND